MESFEGPGILVTQAKVSLQTTVLTTQLLKIKDQYECLVKLIKTMESAKYTIKKPVQAIEKLDFGENTCNINRYSQKRYKTMIFLTYVITMERPVISSPVYSLLNILGTPLLM